MHIITLLVWQGDIDTEGQASDVQATGGHVSTDQELDLEWKEDQEQEQNQQVLTSKSNKRNFIYSKIC